MYDDKCYLVRQINPLIKNLNKSIAVFLKVDRVLILEKHIFMNETETLELACEVALGTGYKLFHRIICPNGRKYILKFSEGCKIYITYRKKKWFIVA